MRAWRGSSWLALLALAGCAHAPTADELFASGRHADAIAMYWHQGEAGEAEQRRTAELERLVSMHRKLTPGRVFARALSAADVAELTGLMPSAEYGKSVLLLEARLAPEDAAKYRLGGFIGVEPPSDTAREEQGLWSELVIFDDAPVQQYDYVGELLTRLWTFPPAPGAHCTAGDGTYIPPSTGSVLAGFFLMITGITPMVSLVSGKDLVNAPFQGRYIPGKHPPHCEPPTDAEVAAWRATPPVHAAESLARALREGGPTRDSTRVLTLVHWVPRGEKTPQRGRALLLELSERLTTSQGEQLQPGGWIAIPLADAPTVAEQLQATFGAQGFDVSKAEDR